MVDKHPFHTEGYIHSRRELMNSQFNNFLSEFQYNSFVGGATGLAIGLIFRRRMINCMFLGMGIGGGIAFNKVSLNFKKIDIYENELKILMNAANQEDVIPDLKKLEDEFLK